MIRVLSGCSSSANASSRCFSPATPLIAEDVAFSIDRARDEVRVELSPGRVARVEMVDPGTVCRAQCEKAYVDKGRAADSS
jgi:hypothetical protein